MLGIFDSGMGGLTVVRAIKDKMPNQSFVYFGDTARFPWGNKSKKLIQQYSSEICNFFISKKIEKIIIACNTASSLADSFLRKKYSKIKFYNVIDPVIDRVEKEIHLKENLKIGIIGTSATIKSNEYEKRIKRNNPEALIYSKACPLFASLVEENWINNKIVKKITKEYLKDFKKINLDVLVLGCTHYPLLKNVIADYLGRKVRIINSAEETARFIQKDTATLLSGEKVPVKEFYYFSDWTEKYQEIMNNILGEEKKPRVIKTINYV